MSTYKHRKLRPWSITSWLLRTIANLISLWPLFLIVTLLVSPITLHMRWTYSYRDIGHERIYYACEYIGPRGFVDYMRGDQCPFFVLIDRRIVN